MWLPLEEFSMVPIFVIVLLNRSVADPSVLPMPSSMRFWSFTSLLMSMLSIFRVDTWSDSSSWIDRDGVEIGGGMRR
jgi:hypothetical protein